MEAWRRGREFVRLLERKQDVLKGDIAKAEGRLTNIKLLIAEYQQEFADINQQIKMLTPAGVLSRADIYKGIRQQGALLTHQQLLFHKITQMEDEKYNLEQSIQRYRASMVVLDKKHYKLNYYLQPLRLDYLRRSDNAAENEIQEMASYGGKSV
jgi:chromosome segregation ATPase